jgi:hypothetical protein
MSEKNEKHGSELSMDELEQVAGGTATPAALPTGPPARNASEAIAAGVHTLEGATLNIVPK